MEYIDFLLILHISIVYTLYCFSNKAFELKPILLNHERNIYLLKLFDPYVFNNQISVWFGKAEAISLKTADTETKDYNITGNVLVEENSTYYLVVGANVDLIDLRPVATEHFDIIVTVSVA